MFKILFVYDQQNEAQAMFTEEGKLLGAWLLSDANWREQHFGPLMRNMGLKVEDRSDDEDLLVLMRENLGIA